MRKAQKASFGTKMSFHPTRAILFSIAIAIVSVVVAIVRSRQVKSRKTDASPEAWLTAEAMSPV